MVDVLGLFSGLKKGATIARNVVDIMLDGGDALAIASKKKAEAVMMSTDRDGNLLYPNAKKDLLRHYFQSQDMANQISKPLSLALGVLKEVGDSQRVPYFNPSKGYFKGGTGFSVDDLGADYAGATDMPLDEAYGRGLFTHTETVPQNNDWSQPSDYGYGEGEYKEVLKKFK